ncbi:hypothetical protein ACWDYH_09510 [Nocardia goodfellowii]
MAIVSGICSKFHRMKEGSTMGKNGKLKSERLAEIEQWQTFRGEVDTWAFDEIESRLGNLYMKVRKCDQPPDLASLGTDIDELRRVIYRRRERLRLYQGQVTA